MRKLAGFLFVVLIWGCNSAEDVRYGDQIIGLASPITLGYDSVESYPNVIRSLAWHLRLH